MTQQPYYPPQYPQPPVPQPQQAQYPAYPQPQAPQGYPPYQGYPQQPAPPPVPLVQGTIDDYFNQPSAGGGPSISWQGKPDGTTIAGVVSRTVTNADIQQQTDPVTQQPKFFRDGRPQFVMKIPLRVQPSAEFPDGEATLFVRGQLRDELVRAMGEAGAPEPVPSGGDQIVVTLVQRKPSRGGNPMNVFAVRYIRANAGAPAPQVQQPVQPPAPQQFQQQPAAPQYQPQAQPQQVQQPMAPPQGPPAPQQYAQAPAPQFAPQQPMQFQQGLQPQAPVDPNAGQFQSGALSPEQQQLLAQLSGSQGQAVA